MIFKNQYYSIEEGCSVLLDTTIIKVKITIMNASFRVSVLEMLIKWMDQISSRSFGTFVIEQRNNNFLTNKHD